MDLQKKVIIITGASEGIGKALAKKLAPNNYLILVGRNYEKLNRLIKDKYLEIDSKKHYISTGLNTKKFLEVQKTTLINLSKLTARVYNLSLMKNN